MTVIFSIVYIFSILSMGVSISWLVMRAERNRITFSFIFCQFIIVIWLFAQCIQLEVVNCHQQFLAYAMGNLGICFIGSVWLLFSLYYSGKKPKKAFIAGMFTVSVIHYMIFLTNDFHHLYYKVFEFGNVERNFFFYTNIVYIYICMLSGIFCIYRKTENDTKYAKSQGALIASAVFIPLCLNLLYLSHVISAKFDVTPLSFSVSSICILLSTYRFGFLNVNQTAFEKIFDNIGEGVMICDKSGMVTYINGMMKKCFHIRTGTSIDDFYSIISDGLKNNEIYFDGRIFSMKQYEYFKNRSENVRAFIISDITEYHEYIERTKQLSVVNQKLAIEKERNRIAQEVHDTIGHTLTMISSLSRLSELEIRKFTNPDIDNDERLEHIGKLKKYVSETASLSLNGISELRVSINNIKNSNTIKITTELQKLVEMVKEIEIDLCIQGEEKPEYSFAGNAIYESCRETITNCLKYSGAERMDIILKFLGTGVEMYIFDNGKGCEKINYGNGLSGIEERIKNIGGTVNFASSKDNGFNTIIKIPIKQTTDETGEIL